MNFINENTIFLSYFDLENNSDLKGCFNSDINNYALYRKEDKFGLIFEKFVKHPTLGGIMISLKHFEFFSNEKRKSFLDNQKILGLDISSQLENFKIWVGIHQDKVFEITKEGNK